MSGSAARCEELGAELLHVSTLARNALVRALWVDVTQDSLCVCVCEQDHRFLAIVVKITRVDVLNVLTPLNR